MRYIAIPRDKARELCNRNVYTEHTENVAIVLRIHCTLIRVQWGL